MKIQDYLNNQHKYKIDTTYQRPPGAWSTEDNQCLIDTILRDEPMPLFFVNLQTRENTFYIVDGQQRLEAIKKFYTNNIKLNKKFSGEDNHNKTFNGENPISDQQREQFLGYNLNFKIIEDYNDEKVRIIFSRLQRGKPLTLGERLNAKPGDIVLRMREIAHHPFMKQSIGITQKRYGNFPDSARVLFYEKHGCRDMGTQALMNFFDKNTKIETGEKEFKNAISVLNTLEKCFPAKPGNYQYLNKHAWVMAVFMMIRELKQKFVLEGKESEIQNFIKDFHGHVYSEDFRASRYNYQKFYDNVRGGWSEKILSLRRDILLEEFNKKHVLLEKDTKRQISEEQKIACFANHPNCEKCGKDFKDYKEAEYHHKKQYSEGGPTDPQNIQVLCDKCHKSIHKNN